MHNVITKSDVSSNDVTNINTHITWMHDTYRATSPSAHSGATVPGVQQGADRARSRGSECPLVAAS